MNKQIVTLDGLARSFIVIELQCQLIVGNCDNHNYSARGFLRLSSKPGPHLHFLRLFLLSIARFSMRQAKFRTPTRFPMEFISIPSKILYYTPEHLIH